MELFGDFESSPWEKLGLEGKLAGKTLEERQKILMDRVLAPAKGLPQNLYNYLIGLLGNYGLVKDMDSLLSDVNESRQRYRWEKLKRKQLITQIEISLTGRENEIVTYEDLAQELKGGAWITKREIQIMLREKIGIELPINQINSDLKVYGFNHKKFNNKIHFYTTAENLDRFKEDYEVTDDTEK